MAHTDLVKIVNYDDVENYESFDVAAEFTIGKHHKQP